MTIAARTVTPWTSELLASLPGIMHAVTHRSPGLGQAEGNVAYSAPRDREDAWAMRQHWCDASQLDASRLVTLGQIHGAEVHVVDARHAGSGARPGSAQVAYGDALATRDAGPVLMTLHADCQPILFVDPGSHGQNPAVAVAHAGWRGTVADIAGQTIDAMNAAFGTRPENVHVALGPAIGPCCYEVGPEVVAAWTAIAGGDAAVALSVRDGSSYFSARDANVYLLQRVGVQVAHMDVSQVCTRCQGDHWFSHRGQGPLTGRFGAMIAIEGNRP